MGGPAYARDNPAAAIPVYIVGPGGVGSSSLLFASEAITAGAAVGLPGVAPAGAEWAQVSSPNQFFWRADGVAPTAAGVGIAQTANTPLTVSAADFANFKAILPTAAAASTLNVNYMGTGTEP